MFVCLDFVHLIFVGQCEVFVLILYIFVFSPLAAKLIGLRTENHSSLLLISLRHLTESGIRLC